MERQRYSLCGDKVYQYPSCGSEVETHIQSITFSWTNVDVEQYLCLVRPIPIQSKQQLCVKVTLCIQLPNRSTNPRGGEDNLWL